ncbi:transporter [Microbulbifer sp. CAU 1566]|uniref:transporter n=1 Tax=Microbulbifer sp. CAU 1566 TaxID=2933269 RepID=UPI00200494D6|nr:transporter [Microbulbifer sp. CAU 1566]MCK7597838.1 transporter [Microbulbifer sp. CAU 1566]
MYSFNVKKLSVALIVTSPMIAKAHDVESPSFLPEAHAPAGVMSDHLHKQGEWMVGYRFMRENFSGLYYGSEKVTGAELNAAGYSMQPSSMAMEMQMLDIMYAVSDNLTLMLMPQTMSMDMTMKMTEGSHMHGDMAMDGMGAMGEMSTAEEAEPAMHASHSHGTSGIGDTVIAGLFRLADTSGYKLHTTLGISAPTGDVDLKNADGTFTHYGMQLGSGTWDFMPSITYSGGRERLSWGAQASARLPMEDKNDSGFRFGERYAATAWSAYRLTNWLSLSSRLSYTKQLDINGHYNGPHNHSSPADLQKNYGGEFVDAAVGANMVPQGGALAGVRLGLEWSSRVSGHYNGYQLGRDDGLNMSLSYAF